MIGQVICLEKKGRCRTELRDVCGMPVVLGTLCVPPKLSAWRLEWRAASLQRKLLRLGAGRVVLPEGFPYRGLLKELKTVDPLPFWQAMADRLVLAALQRNGVRPDRSTVVLSGPRLSPELRRTAEALHTRVRILVIDVPGVGQDYARWLHIHYGMPVAPAAAGGEVTAAFGPGGIRMGSVLELYGERPNLGALEVSCPGVEFPEGCAGQYLTLLWEQGQLNLDSLEITAK